MSEPHATDSWFHYFPENYLWSQVTCVMLNLAPMGGSTLWEVDQVGKRLKDKLGDKAAWIEEWDRMADYVLHFAEKEEEKGHTLTAARAFVRSSVYRYASERQIHPDDPRKEAAYRKVTAHFERGMHTLAPGFERVEVPYEEGPLPAFWLPPLNGGGNAPAVVFFDGLDASKESTVLWGLALRERGIGVLCVDGPGQGEALRLNKIPSRHDYEVPATAAYDYIFARPDVDPERIGLMAMSMGGYYAPRAAAFEHRYCACLTWGAHFDFHEVWVERRRELESGGTVTASSIWQLPWVMGCSDIDSALEKAKAYNLEGVAQKIRMPICITNGRDDRIVSSEMAYRLYETCGSPEKELKIFTPEDGGSQHCVFDNLPMVSNWIADWWMDRFGTRS
ncbi:alpha/beta hydrolase family protein [Nitrospinota bacterium]